jgi:hypothetical protein
MTSKTEQKQITIVFRYDDFSTLSLTDVETKLFQYFRDYQLPCTLGIIPYVVDGDIEDPAPQENVLLTKKKAGIIAKDISSGLFEAALHGYTHQTIRERGNLGGTEFEGLNYSEQAMKLSEGQKFLETLLDTEISTFIPPWNSYDENTLRILIELGITTISAGRNGASLSFSDINYLPSTCGLADVDKAISLARKDKEPFPVIVVWLNGCDFIEDQRDGMRFRLADFEKLLERLSSQSDIQLRTINDTTRLIGGLTHGQYAKYSFLSSRIGRMLIRRRDENLYLSPNMLRKTMLKFG